MVSRYEIIEIIISSMNHFSYLCDYKIQLAS